MFIFSNHTVVCSALWNLQVVSHHLSPLIENIFFLFFSTTLTGTRKSLRKTLQRKKRSQRLRKKINDDSFQKLVHHWLPPHFTSAHLSTRFPSAVLYRETAGLLSNCFDIGIFWSSKVVCYTNCTTAYPVSVSSIFFVVILFERPEF